jgi:hypothetical protein
VASLGRPYAQGLAGAQRAAALEELAHVERFFRYCSGLRERRPLHQRKYINEVLRIGAPPPARPPPPLALRAPVGYSRRTSPSTLRRRLPVRALLSLTAPHPLPPAPPRPPSAADEDILQQELRAGVLKPSYILTRDTTLGAIVLAVRGTHSFKDAFTSLTGASKPHHLVDSNNVVLGHAHFGMLAAARWLRGEVAPSLEAALAANPGFSLYLVGHSLGAGTAAMLTMMLRERGGAFAGARCVAIACPACMTLELARSCAGYVTTVVNATDVVPTICPATADALRLEVTRSAWFQEFRGDVRASAVVRAVEAGVRGVGGAAATASTWTAARLTACVSRRPASLKRRNSDGGLEALDGGGGDAAAEEAEADDLALPPPPGAAAAAAAEWGPSLSRFAAVASSVAAFTGRQAQSLGRGASAVSEAASRLAAAKFSGGSLLALSRVWGPAAPPPLTALDASQRHSSGGEWGEGEGEGEDGGDAAGPPGAPAAKSRRRVVGAGAAGSPPRAASAETGAPPAMDMDMELELEEEDAAALDPLHGAGGGGGLGVRGSLEAEASVRMAAVARAVSAAEAEEAAAGAAAEPHVPSIIRPGGYGHGAADGNTAAGPSGRDPAAEAAWRRAMFPAGRILHLVPARLVPGLQPAAAAAVWEHDSDSDASGGGGGGGAPSAAAPPPARCWPEAVMEEGEDYPGTTSPRLAALSQGQGGGAPLVEEPSLRHLLPPQPGGGGEEPSGGGAAPPPPPPPVPAEDMVLLEGVPQEAYARIRLCRTVLSDHIIPSYLRSLESALRRV